MADSNITTETPTANHRPRRTIRFEVELREFVNDRISRGIVEASLEFDPEDPEYWEKRDEYLGYAIAHAMERAFLGGTMAIAHTLDNLRPSGRGEHRRNCKQLHDCAHQLVKTEQRRWADVRRELQKKS